MNSLNDVKMIDLPKIADERGNLSIIENLKLRRKTKYENTKNEGRNTKDGDCMEENVKKARNISSILHLALRMKWKLNSW